MPLHTVIELRPRPDGTMDMETLRVDVATAEGGDVANVDYYPAHLPPPAMPVQVRWHPMRASNLALNMNDIDNCRKAVYLLSYGSCTWFLSSIILITFCFFANLERPSMLHMYIPTKLAQIARPLRGRPCCTCACPQSLLKLPAHACL